MLRFKPHSVPGTRYVWTEYKGTDNAKININGNDKEGVTATLTINASGLMLKPIITAKGKTNLSLRKYKLYSVHTFFESIYWFKKWCESEHVLVFITFAYANKINRV